jgi:hypothetical protein
MPDSEPVKADHWHEIIGGFCKPPKKTVSTWAWLTESVAVPSKTADGVGGVRSMSTAVPKAVAKSPERV